MVALNDVNVKELYIYTVNTSKAVIDYVHQTT